MSERDIDEYLIIDKFTFSDEVVKKEGGEENGMQSPASPETDRV